ncbi:MAG: hypothetical protein QOC77_1677 [Thermoleophilaceae bacterium]|jgi:hypothetical protein|nr:hypothetical protein [Thermoleophilaceae bacterium]
MRISKRVLAGTISAAMLLGASPAFGVTSAQSGYSKPGGIVETQIQNGGGGGNNPGSVVSTPERATQAKSNSSGTLPFTGLDLVLVVAAGGLLLGLGLGMRRLTRPTTIA